MSEQDKTHAMVFMSLEDARRLYFACNAAVKAWQAVTVLDTDSGPPAVAHLQKLQGTLLKIIADLNAREQHKGAA